MDEATADTSTTEAGEAGSAEESAPVEERRVTAKGEDIATLGLTPSEDEKGEESAPEERAEPEKTTIKVNGETLELTHDELVKLAQKGSAADRKFRAAAEQRKKVEAAVQKLQGDPLLAAYLSGGKDAMLDALEKQLEYDQLSPEDRAKADEDRSLREKAKKAEEYEREQSERELEALTVSYQEQWTDIMNQALSSVGLGQDPRAYRELAGALETAIASGQPFELATLAREVAQDLNEGASTFAKSKLAGLKGEELVTFLGPEVMREVRAYEAARLKGAGANVTKTKRGANGVRGSKAAPKQTTSEFFKELRERGG